MKRRSYGYDNMRALLIVCVVAGHLLEVVGGKAAAPVRNVLYFLIYSFHIPGMIFLNGFFAEFSWKRVFHYMGLYFLFQTIYLTFKGFVLGSMTEYQFHTPYWLLWYLMSLTCYVLLVPVLERIPKKLFPVVVLVALLVSLGAGYSEDIGYKFSLSRTLVFLPFFVLGHFAGRKKNRLRYVFRMRPALWGCLSAAALVMTGLLYAGGVSKTMLYGSYSYETGGGWAVRLAIFLTASLWIAGLLGLCMTKLDRKIPLVSVVGRNTLSVYLLHGFAVRLVGKYNWDHNSLLGVAVITVLLVALLGNPWVGSLFRGPAWNASRKISAGNPTETVL